MGESADQGISNRDRDLGDGKTINIKRLEIISLSRSDKRVARGGIF